MSSINVYPVLVTWKVSKKDGSCPLHLSIDYKNKRVAFPSLSRKILPKDWDDKSKKVKSTAPNAAVINAVIKKRISAIDETLLKYELSGKPISKQIIIDLVKGTDSTSVKGFFSDYIKYIKEPRKSKNEKEDKKFSDNNIRKWEIEYKRLVEYAPGDLKFSDITIAWLEKYETHCSKTLDKNTSLAVTMSRFKQILRKADAKNLFDIKSINNYKLPPYVGPTRPYLTLEETDAIADLVYKGKLNSNHSLLKVACYFLVECWSGLRFSDWRRFEREKLIHNNSLKVRAQKNGEPVYVPLHNSPRLSKIVQFIIDNNLIFDEVEQTTNKLLKVLALLTDPVITISLTTHVGRHTCAVLLLEMGYSKETIAEWLGISLKTVEVYAKMTRRKIHNEYEKLGGL